MGRGYLLVYLAKSDLPGERWVDIGNDPELRTTPMTWGICRTNVRRRVARGDELFFVAYRKDAGYFLSAFMKVAELIGQDEAVVRFSGRCNVILDRLPPGRAIAEQVRRYLSVHIDELAWAKPDRTTALAALPDHTPASDELLAAFTAEVGGVRYVHAYYDEHADWKEGQTWREGRRRGSGRIDATYVVGDAVRSKILADPIPYVELWSDCTALPPPEELRNGANRHPDRRVHGAVMEYLRERVRDAEARTVLPFTPGLPPGRCSESAGERSTPAAGS